MRYFVIFYYGKITQLYALPILCYAAEKHLWKMSFPLLILFLFWPSHFIVNSLLRKKIEMMKYINKGGPVAIFYDAPVSYHPTFVCDVDNRAIGM